MHAARAAVGRAAPAAPRFGDGKETRGGGTSPLPSRGRRFGADDSTRGTAASRSRLVPRRPPRAIADSPTRSAGAADEDADDEAEVLIELASPAQLAAVRAELGEAGLESLRTHMYGGYVVKQLDGRP